MSDRAAAGALDRLRQNWLNPPEWTREEVLEFPGSVEGPWGRYVERVAPSGRDGAVTGNKLAAAGKATRKKALSAAQSGESLAGLLSVRERWGFCTPR